MSCGPLDLEEAARRFIEVANRSVAPLGTDERQEAFEELEADLDRSDLRGLAVDQHDRLVSAVWEWYVARGEARMGGGVAEAARLARAEQRLGELARKPT